MKLNESETAGRADEIATMKMWNFVVEGPSR